MNFNQKKKLGRKFEFLCDKFQRVKKFLDMCPMEPGGPNYWVEKNAEIQTRMEMLAIHLGNFAHKSGQYKQCLFSKRSWKRKWIFAENVRVSTKCNPNGEGNMQLIPVNNRRTQI